MEELSLLCCSTEDHLPLLCVDKHPGQAHIVATGGQDGMLTVWDLRQHRFPMTLLEAHTSSSKFYCGVVVCVISLF